MTSSAPRQSRRSHRLVACLVGVTLAATLPLVVTEPVQAASRPGATATDPAGDVEVTGGKPGAEQKRNTDIGHVEVTWSVYGELADDSVHPGVDIWLDIADGTKRFTSPLVGVVAEFVYRRPNGSSGTATLTLQEDPSAPMGLVGEFINPNINQDGLYCTGVLFGSGGQQMGGHYEAGWGVGTEAACLENTSQVAVTVTLSTKTAAGTAEDVVRLKTAKAPSVEAWRYTDLHTENKAHYSPWGGEKFAEIMGGYMRYLPAQDTAQVALRFAALSRTKREPTQRISMWQEGDRYSGQGADLNIVAVLPGSGGRSGSLKVTGGNENCDEATVDVAKSRWVTITIPASCIPNPEFEPWIDVATMRGKREDSGEQPWASQAILLS